MEVTLHFAAVHGAGEVMLTKTLKKAPAVLPIAADTWLQAGWPLVVQEREWAEALDKVTIYLRPAEDVGRRHIRDLARDLADAGWSEGVGHYGD